MPQALILKRYFIACEGNGDSAFLTELCKARNIGIFDIAEAGGNTKFSKFLEGVTKATSANPLDTILIVGDNDEGPQNSFERIQRQIRSASERTDLAVPNNVFELAARNKSATATAVMMIPFDNNRNPVVGCLETLLLQAVTPPVAALAECVHDFRQCVDGPAWRKVREDKMRLRCLVAAAHEEDPNVSLRFAVSPSKGIFDLAHNCFDGIVEFLANFETWISQQRQERFRGR